MLNDIIRTFRNGDEKAIVELFNSVHNAHAGFVPRTVEYWRWCCLNRPDVEKKGIFLAFNGESLRGYLVAGSSGNIWEFCVKDDDEKVASALLEKAVSHLENSGVSSINVNVTGDTSISETLLKMGFDLTLGGEMFVTTLNPAALVHDLVTPQRDVLTKRLNGEFGFRLRDVPFGVSEEFSVKIHSVDVEVDEGLTTEPSVIVELGLMDLLSVLFKGSSVSRLALTGRMRVKPFWKLSAVSTLLSIIRLQNSWFFPLSDLM